MIKINEYRSGTLKIKFCTSCASECLLQLAQGGLINNIGYDVGGRCQRCGAFEREFEYVGSPVLTRGNFGVNVEKGYNKEDDPYTLYIHDSDCGDMPWSSIDAALKSGDWIEV